MRKYRGDAHADVDHGADRGSGDCKGRGSVENLRARLKIFCDQRRRRKDPVGRGEGPAKCSEAANCAR